MKQVRQKLAYFLMIAIVFGMVVPSTAVKAAAPVFNSVLIDYINQEARISVDHGEIYYTDAAYTAEKEKAGRITWETANVFNSMAVIDLSWLSGRAKSIFVKAVSGGGSTVIKVEIPARDTKFKAAFSGNGKVKLKGSGTETILNSSNAIGDEKNGYIYFTTEDSSRKTMLVGLGNVEVRKGLNGTYRSAAGFLLESLSNKGASLYFRTVTGVESAMPATGSGIETYSAKNIRPNSKEYRLSYKKRSSASAVTLDGSRMLLSLRKGQEYKVDTGDWINVYDTYKDAKGYVPKITLFDLYYASGSAVTYNYQPMVIQVRTAATATRLASKIYTLKAVSPLTTSASVGAVTSPVSTSGVSVGYQKAYDKESGLTVSNATKYDLQVAVVPDTAVAGGMVSPDFSWETASWSTVRAATSRGAGLLKISSSTVKKALGSTTGGYLFVRPASVRADSSKGIPFQVAGRVQCFDLDNISETKQTLTAVGGVTGGSIVLQASTGQSVTARVSLTASNITSPDGTYAKAFESTASGAAVSVKAPKLSVTVGRIKTGSNTDVLTVKLDKVAVDTYAADKNTFITVTVEGASITIPLTIKKP